MRQRHNDLFSTHLLGVIETMCHRVSIIQKGRIVAIGRVDQLRTQAQHEHGDLEEVFLKLTGDADFASLLDSLRGKPRGQWIYFFTTKQFQLSFWMEV